MSEKGKRMIVKVQLSQFDSRGEKRLLVYNKSRTVQYEGEATPEIIAEMGDEQKKFFRAAVNHETGKIEIQDDAPWQEW